ncbi:MAG: C40 family peptidase [Gammaproteobacteria bacterium]
MRTIVTGLIVILASGCAATAPLEPGRSDDMRRSVDQRPLQLGERIAGHAVSMVGSPYRYGGSTPETGFDCSGLVFYSFGQTGISVPRTSLAQFRSARKISLHDAGEGDILFFQDQEKLSHVGIFIGGGRFVHAPASGRSVSIASLDNPYYQMHLVGVGRLLP